MKCKRIAVCFCAAALLTLTGCGDSKTDASPFGDVRQDGSANAADMQENRTSAEMRMLSSYSMVASACRNIFLHLHF